MSMLITHEEALKSSNVVYHKFLLVFRADRKRVYGIVEGKDDPMAYRGIIVSLLPEGWDVELTPADSKQNVLASIGVFDWKRFARQQICFFVDRDLQEFLPGHSLSEENLYITDGYSIENNVVTPECFRRLLEEVFNLGSLTAQEADIVESHFNKGLKLFCDTLRPVMAQIVLWQRESRRPSLDNIRIKDWFAFHGARMEVAPAFVAVGARIAHAAACVQLPASSADDINTVEGELAAAGLSTYIRGKYLLWFMIAYATSAVESVSTILPRFGARPKMHISVGPKNTMVLMAPRIRCPKSLRAFIDSNFVSFIHHKVAGQAAQEGVAQV